jgi:F0F1-type ATP synthase assembly protein I
MAEKEREPFLSRSLKSMQDNIIKAGPAASAGYTLIGAILFLGGIGYAIDAWRGTSPWFLVSGLLLGIIVGFFELARMMWPR